MTDGQIGAIVGLVIVGMIVVICATSLWANLAWAPHAADIRVEEIKMQTACINAGGLWNGTNCAWGSANASH